jgi:hypothetical protein
MGGWCAKRGHCPHHQQTPMPSASERLCPPGRDGEVLRRLSADPRFAAWAASAPAAIEVDE